MQHGGSRFWRRLRAAWRTAVLPEPPGRTGRMPARGPDGPMPCPDGIVCLRLTCPLREDAVGALADAVNARLRAAPAGTVVLDLSETAVIGDRVRTVLQLLDSRLEHEGVRLRLVVPEAGAHAALQASSAGRAIGRDALHTSVRTAILATYAALPGPASVTPALRMLLTQPPELLFLDDAHVSPDDAPARRQAQQDTDAISGDLPGARGPCRSARISAAPGGAHSRGRCRACRSGGTPALHRPRAGLRR
jgi:hypothetical protein